MHQAIDFQHRCLTQISMAHIEQPGCGIFQTGGRLMHISHAQRFPGSFLQIENTQPGQAVEQFGRNRLLFRIQRKRHIDILT